MENDPSTLTIRRYQPGDEKGIVDTFNRVFRDVGGDAFVDRTMEQWRWQFLDNLMGHRISLAVAPDGTIVSQYCGMPQLADTAFGEQVFVHCLDSFTHPEWRKGLKRPGIFVVTGLPFSARSREIHDALLYGYPIPIAERIGTRFLEYNYMRTVDFLVAPTDQDSIGAVDTGVVVTEETGIPKEVDELYRVVKEDKACLLRRDHRYLDWRFVQVPAPLYRVFAARRGGDLVGLAIIRTGFSLIPDAGTIADWLVPTGDDETRRALSAAVRRATGEDGKQHLLTVFPQPTPEWESFQGIGYRAEASSQWLERRLIGLVTAPKPLSDTFTYDWLLDNWWYTLGDSDLV